MTPRPRLGLVLGGTEPPDAMLSLARLADEVGFDELWVTEDCWFTGALSAIGAVLAATRRVRVGTAVVSAFTRHPSILALEMATLARLFPGRVVAGIGLGLPDWLTRMGVRPDGMREPLGRTVGHIRALLRGGTVTAEGPPFQLDQIALAHPPTVDVPIVLGVAGPRLLELSGEVADGTLLGLNSAPAYVRWARERIGSGAERAGRAGPHVVTCMTFFSIADDAQQARMAVRPRIAEYLAFGTHAGTDAYGISEELSGLIRAGGRAAVEQGMPDAWLDDLAVAGDAEDCRAAVSRLAASGADAVAFYPQPADRAEEVVRLAAQALLA